MGINSLMGKPSEDPSSPDVTTVCRYIGPLRFPQESKVFIDFK